MRSRQSLSAAAVLALWCLVAPGSLAWRGRVESHPQASTLAGQVGVRETVLARLDADANLQTIAVDPRTICRVSWISGAKGSQRLYVDGVPGPVFDEVVSPYTAYEAHSKGLVWWFPPAQDSASIFSPDGGRCVYPAKRGKWFVVADGVEYGPYDIVTGPAAFSPDGKHAIWEARGKGKFARVIDGVAHGPFEYGRFPASPRGVTFFSPDSRRSAFPARMREGGHTVARMIVDGANGPPYSMVGNPHFSPDSQHIAYWVHAEGQHGLQLMVDDKPVAQTTKSSPELLEFLDNVLADSRLPFAPDEAHLAFVTERDGKLLPVVHGKEGPRCHWISPIVFNADYTHAAYVIGWKRDPLSFIAAWVTGSGGDYKYRLVVDGIERTEGPSPSDAPVILTPDGKHAPAYLGPNGKRLAYVTERDVVVDGAGVSRRGEDAYDPAFSPDGTRVAAKLLAQFWGER
jgi:hypothetical protein